MSNIQLRKNPFSESSDSIEYLAGERLHELLDRVLELHKYPLEDSSRNHFQILVNGLQVDRELWPVVSVKESDTVLIAPIISRGDGGQLFKQIAIIAITLTAAYFTAGMSNAFLAGAIVMTATIAGTLAMNALIPPPMLDGIGGGLGGSLEESQMYSITGQSNSISKYGIVPKVYGRHRVFPTIAATPYTDIEVDEGKVVQIMNAIYDFGIGPNYLEDLKIGDTPLESFRYYERSFVDLNRPTLDEGGWDSDLAPAFGNYANDVESDAVAVNLDLNITDATTDYSGVHTVIRRSSNNTDGSPQEISLDFVFPQGLIAHGTDGTTSPRSVMLEVQFRKVGTVEWVRYNDLSYVEYFYSTGGIPSTTVFFPIKEYIPPVSTGEYIVEFRGSGERYGARFPAGYIVVYGGLTVNVGDKVYAKQPNQTFEPQYKGIITSIGAHPFNHALKILYLDTTGVSTGIGYLWASEDGNAPWLGEEDFYELSTGFHFHPVRLYIEGTLFGGAEITAETTKPYYASFKFKPIDTGDFEVRVVRMKSSSTKNYQILDRITLTSITTKFFRPVINTNQRHRFLELKIRATNQLNGTIQNLSGVVTSVLDVYDPITETWSKQPTRNPAWVLVDLLTGPINKKAISKSRLHLPSILEWAEFCDEIPDSPQFTQPRFQCDFVLDFSTTLQSIINTITSAAQASLNIIDGKYGVLVDKHRTTPVQIFTPRNSSGFSSSINYVDPPHAIKVRFVDGEGDWSTQEVIVYADGYNELNATEFDELSTFACTNHEQAWRFGRYMMAQAKLRRETISLKVDFEYLVCTRGDFVQITQDVMKVGGTPARVIETIAPNIVVIDEDYETSNEIANYGYTFRSSEGTILTNTLTVVDHRTFELDGTTLPSVGDLIVIGEVGKTVFDCIVKSIQPDDELTATLTLVERAPEVHEAELGGVLPAYTPKISSSHDDSKRPNQVTDLTVVENDWRFINEDYQYYIKVSWNPPTSGPLYETFEVYMDSGDGYELYGYTTANNYEFIVDKADLGINHHVKVLSVNSFGKKIDFFNSVVTIPIKKTSPPSDVTYLNMSTTSENVILEWEGIYDVDTYNYEIRYSPIADATWNTSTPLTNVRHIVGQINYSATVSGRDGTYLIKAKDYNGNVSATPAMAITTIPGGFTENIIKVTDTSPGFVGNKEYVESTMDGGIKLSRYDDGLGNLMYFSEGYYYFRIPQDNFSMGSNYNFNLSAFLDVEGVDDSVNMAYWPVLSNVSPIAFEGNPDYGWNVEMQYRVFKLVDGLDEIGPWTTFTTATVLGRTAQFRIKLTSSHPLKTPIVRSASITIDMDDRVEYHDNIVVPEEGLLFTYDHFFYGPVGGPSIKVTQDNASQGDFYVIENKTLNDFTIKFYDNEANPVERVADFTIRGYGKWPF